MSGIVPTGLIHALVAEKHADGIINYLLTLEEMCRRVDAVAVHYNHGTPAQPGLYRGFVESCYGGEENQVAPNIPGIPNAITFQAIRDPSPFAHTHLSDNGRQYYIIDVAADDISLIVPLGRYVPYQRHAPGRSAIVLGSIEPVPYWIVGQHGLGVPISGGEVYALQHGERQFTNGPGGRWPGYASWQAQIRMRHDGRQPGDSFTFRRLVNQVRGKVRKFITEHARIQSTNLHWAVGITPGRITADDLTLLAIVSVSQGAVMPILKLRDDFVFSTMSTQSVGVSSPSMSYNALGSLGSPVSSSSLSIDFFDYDSTYNLEDVDHQLNGQSAYSGYY
ncbi:unnamed protein product [Peniophora sp. CBMAI 1063]|nr:unnamed protein product [Peniophora sp. CBMAI 1063]